MKPQFKLIFVAPLIACAILSSCSKSLSFEGKVIDATINTIQLASETDTLIFSIHQSDPARVPGVLIGDVVRLKYCETEDEENVFFNNVQSLEIISPSYYRLIAGTWLRNGVNDADFYGFTLADDGSAESVNNVTMLVKEWVLDGEELALTVDSVFSTGNIQTNLIYKIEKLDADSLILLSADGSVAWPCARQ